MDSFNNFNAQAQAFEDPTLSDSKSSFKRTRPQSVRPKNWSRTPRRARRENPWGRKERTNRIGNSRQTSNKRYKNPASEFYPTQIQPFHEQRLTEADHYFLQTAKKVVPFVSETAYPGHAVSHRNTQHVQFNYTLPKSVGWVGFRNPAVWDNTMHNEDERNFNNEPDSCLGILHNKMDPEKKPECVFCKRNNAKDFYHPLKDNLGGVVCPVLSAFTCKMCAATGRNAHTHKYCPVNPITKGDPVAAGMPPGRPLTKVDKQWLKYFHARLILNLFLESEARRKT